MEIGKRVWISSLVSNQSNNNSSSNNNNRSNSISCGSGILNIDYCISVIGTLESVSSQTVTVKDLSSTCHRLKDVIKSITSSSSTTIEIPKKYVYPFNSADDSNHNDLVNIDDLTEYTLIHHLGQRYNNDSIYTWIGNILVSINPFKDLSISNKTNHFDDLLSSSPSSSSSPSPSSPIPHVYSIASKAYNQLINERTNQSIVISGESGSGKTECSKSIIQYLVGKSRSRQTPPSTPSSSPPMSPHSSSSSSTSTKIEKDLLTSSPILEAFGNAQTPRNNNSSRFGKFIKIEFDSNSGVISGAQIETYLLEKSRISHRPDDANLNYHIFYSMIYGASSEDHSKWFINNSAASSTTSTSKAKMFRYLNARDDLIATVESNFKKSRGGGAGGGGGAGVGLETVHDFQTIKQSMQAIDISPNDLDAIFKSLAAILHIGNIEFEEDAETKYAHISDKSAASLDHAAQLLGVIPSMFRVALLNRKLKASGRGSVYARPNDISQAESSRDTLSKSLYARIFKFIVDSINRKFNQNNTSNNNNNNNNNNTTAANKNKTVNNNNSSSSSSSNNNKQNTRFIGILDIFGFENLSNNSLEQLLINFTNEKLQNQFNQAVFHEEQKEYISEGIQWSNSTFVDNKDCIDCIEKKGEGLLSLLDDESIMPKGSEHAYLEKCNQKYKQQPYQRTLGKLTFGIKHFAGDVTYNIDGWLEKNRDSLYGDIEDLMIQGNRFIKQLYNNNSNGQPQPSTTTTMNSRPTSTSSMSSTSSSSSSSSSPSSPSAPKRQTGGNTVASQFLGQLTQLVHTLNSTTLHYIRCIKPNQQLENKFDAVEVISQLRSVGLMSTIQVRKNGYSYRRDINSFLNRFKILINCNKNNNKNGKCNNSNNNNSSNNNHQTCREILENIESKLLIASSSTTTTTTTTKNNQKTSSNTSPASSHLWAIGKSKVFISDRIYNMLEIERNSMVKRTVQVIEKYRLAKIQRNQYLESKKRYLLLQCAIRSTLARKKLQQMQQQLQLEMKKKQQELEAKRKEEEKQRLQQEAEMKKKQQQEQEAKRKEEEKQRLQQEKQEKHRKEMEEKKLKQQQKQQQKQHDDLLKQKEKEKEKEKEINEEESRIEQQQFKLEKNYPLSASAPAVVEQTIFEKWRRREVQNSQESPTSSRLRFPGIGTRKPTPTQPIPIPSQMSSKSSSQIGSIDSSNDVVSSPSSSSSSPPVSPSSSSSTLSPVGSPVPRQRISLSNKSISFDYGKTPSSPRKSRLIKSPSTSSDQADSPFGSPSSTSPHIISTMSQRQFRTKIIAETIETERDYCRDLQMTIDVFLVTIRERQLLNPKDIQTLFGNIEILLNINQTMLEELEKKIETAPSSPKEGGEDTDSTTTTTTTTTTSTSSSTTPPIDESTSNVGQAFLKMSHYLKMYTFYCSNQQQALKLLEDETVRNQAFRNFLEDRMTDSRCRGLPLLSYLIKPVQRICKYPLLLKEILKYTPEGHREREALVEADKKIQEVVSSINEGKRDVEMFQKIFELQSSIENIDLIGEIVKPGRILLQQAQVTGVRELSNPDDTLQRHIFLFNDLILILGPATSARSMVSNLISNTTASINSGAAGGSGGGGIGNVIGNRTKQIYRAKASIPISTARIMFVSDSESVKYAIELSNTVPAAGKNSNDSFILCFQNEQQRSSWLKQIKSMIQEYRFNQLPSSASSLHLSPTLSSSAGSIGGGGSLQSRLFTSSPSRINLLLSRDRWKNSN